MSIIKEAVDMAGKAGLVADAMGISRISVYEWIEKGRVPPERVRALAKLTGWLFAPHDLAPDIYPYLRDGVPPRAARRLRNRVKLRGAASLTV